MINEGVLFALAIGIVVAASIPGLYLFYQNLKRNDPATFETMRQTITALSKRLDEAEQAHQQELSNGRAALAQLHHDINQLRIEFNRVSIWLDRWIDYGLRLGDIMREKNLTVPPSPQEQDAAKRQYTAEPDDRSLQVVIASLFNRDEVDDLAFRLGINDDSLEGETVDSRSRALVLYARRHGMTDKLIAAIRELRPDGKI